MQLNSLAPEHNMILSPDSYHLDPDVTRQSLKLLILQTIRSTVVSIGRHLQQKQHVYLKELIYPNHTYLASIHAENSFSQVLRYLSLGFCHIEMNKM